MLIIECVCVRAWHLIQNANSNVENLNFLPKFKLGVDIGWFQSEIGPKA